MPLVCNFHRSLYTISDFYGQINLILTSIKNLKIKILQTRYSCAKWDDTCNISMSLNWKYGYICAICLKYYLISRCIDITTLDLQGPHILSFSYIRSGLSEQRYQSVICVLTNITKYSMKFFGIIIIGLSYVQVCTYILVKFCVKIY